MTNDCECEKCKFHNPPPTLLENLRRRFSYWYKEWKYNRLPLEKKKQTIRYQIEEASKTGQPTVVLLPGKYGEPINLKAGISLKGVEKK